MTSACSWLKVEKYHNMKALKALKGLKEAILGKDAVEQPPKRKEPGIKDLDTALSNTGRLLQTVRKALTSRIINVTDLNLIAEDEVGNWFVGTAVNQPKIKGKVQPPLIGFTFLPLASSAKVLNFSDRDNVTIPKLRENLPQFKNFRFVTQREMNEKAAEYLEQIMAATKEVRESLLLVEEMKKNKGAE